MLRKMYLSLDWTTAGTYLPVVVILGGEIKRNCPRTIFRYNDGKQSVTNDDY